MRFCDNNISIGIAFAWWRLFGVSLGRSFAILVHQTYIRPIAASGFLVGFVCALHYCAGWHIALRNVMRSFRFCGTQLGVISNSCPGILGMLVLGRYYWDACIVKVEIVEIVEMVEMVEEFIG